MSERGGSFALRIVRRQAGDAAIVYRRRLTEDGRERHARIAAISPLAFSAATSLLRDAVRAMSSPTASLVPGPFHPLDDDWGARVACYAFVAAGLRDASRLQRAASSLRQSDGTEAAWWLSLMANGTRKRAVRALRILTEAVM